MSIWIKEIFVEYQKEPLGLDEEFPRFSWLLDADENGARQTAYSITVTHAATGIPAWTSGKVSDRCSTGIAYSGQDLAPCTRYYVSVAVWDESDRCSTAETWFETGFMCQDRTTWEGAQWISAPQFHLAAQERGVFGIETEFRLAAGNCAAIVFGANDPRLLCPGQNEYGLAGENFIRYEVDWNGGAPQLVIRRVGYAPEDSLAVPLAAVPLRGKDGEYLLDEGNLRKFHKLEIEVVGNRAAAKFDGVWVDGDTDHFRTLNPLGDNDVLPFPRLNEIGFYVAPGSTALFHHYRLYNLRTPGATFLYDTPDGGLYGTPSIFAEKVPVEGKCFLARNIQVTANPSYGGLTMLRCQFQVEEGKELLSARLYLTSRGIYDCCVNGKSVSERVLPPGLTQYDKRMSYQTYDISTLLSPGSNAVGVTLASGWWCDGQTYVVRNYNYFGDKEALLAKLVLTYADGTRQTIVSSPETWKWSDSGPYRYAGLFNGEIYDARKKEVYEQFSCPAFDDTDWKRPIVDDPTQIESFNDGFSRTWPSVHQNPEGPVYTGGYDAPVRIVARIPACGQSKYGDAVIYDFGQEMAGVPRILFHEQAGTEIRIRYAEMLYPNLPEYGDRAGAMMVENYRDAVSTDIYICAGSPDGEVYQPKFTFHGYRYLEISGAKNPPAPTDVVSLQYSSIQEITGEFSCSDPRLSRFAQNVSWSQLCNFINIPTDCPQRNERMGWSGDVHAFCHTAMQNADLKLFYERQLQAIADLQELDGRLPEVAPVGGGFGGITYECAAIFITWELYLQYGDLRTVRRMYPVLKKYMDYMKGLGLPGPCVDNRIGPLADWLALQETDEPLLWNAFYYREADLMAKLAELAEESEDAQEFQSLAAHCKDWWNETFIDPVTKMTRTIDGALCDTQCSYALPLAYGVVSDRAAAGEHLARTVRQSNHTIGTGFFGTVVLNQALSATGHSNEAWKLMLQTACPSWLYSVTQGATTIWEHWDSYTHERGFGGYNAMNSFNHCALGSVLSWLYETVLGIQDGHNGHFRLQPDVRELDYAKGRIATPYGILSSGWSRRDGQIEYICSIPINADAVLVLPDGTMKRLDSGDYKFSLQEEVSL